MKRIAILGAGVSGLSLAYFLRQRFGDQLQLSLIEKKARSGGWVRTLVKEGFLFDLGPRSCRPKGAGIEHLILAKELGLEEQVLLPAAAAKRRYLCLNGELEELPHKLWQLPFSKLLRPAWKELWRELRRKPSKLDRDESIYDFARRHFGPYIAETFFDPMVKGIYAGDCRELSLASCFPTLSEWEQQDGSIVKAALFAKRAKQLKDPFLAKMQKHALFSYQGGMQTLTDALEAQVKDCLLLNHEIDSIDFSQENTVWLHFTGEQESLPFDHVISTLPAFQQAQVMGESDLAKLLRGIPFRSIWTVNLGYHRKVLPKEGFGYLVPSKEREEVLGCVWDSSVFPGQNKASGQTRLTVMLDPRVTDPLGVALLTLEKHLNIRREPEVVLTRFAKDCIPQYTIGHQQRLALVEGVLNRDYPRLSLLGNSYFGVAVNDCIQQARCFAEDFYSKTLQKKPTLMQDEAKEKLEYSR